MKMHTEKHGFRRGSSLVETMIGLLIFLIVVLGSANYRYLTAIDMRNAKEQLAGADLAVTLLGAWQGMGGSDSYGPDNQFSSYLSISPAKGDSVPDGYTLLGAYDVIYAPSAALTLDNSATLCGSATTLTCTLKNSASVRYDASLREYDDPAFVGTLKLSSWREY